MAKGSSGLSGGSKIGGGGAFSKIEGDNITLKVHEDGQTKEINISIQDMSQYTGQDVRLGQGNMSYAPVSRVLAGDAVDNATNKKRADFIDLPEGVEGKFTKTDKVPVSRFVNTPNGGQAHVLETTTGYVTKINGETVYLQKVSGGFQWNYAGISMGDAKVKSLKAAKEDPSWVTSTIDKLKNGTALSSARGQLQVLNKNHGKVDSRVWKEIGYNNFTHIANRNG